MVKLFNRIFFSNGTTPALNATNLNAMSKAIDEIDGRVVDLGNHLFRVITIGTTTTLPAGSSATVENVGTSIDPILNFGIPKGDPGDMQISVYDPTNAVADAGGLAAYIDDMITDALSASY